MFISIRAIHQWHKLKAAETQADKANRPAQVGRIGPADPRVVALQQQLQNKFQSEAQLNLLLDKQVREAADRSKAEAVAQADKARDENAQPVPALPDKFHKKSKAAQDKIRKELKPKKEAAEAHNAAVGQAHAADLLKIEQMFQGLVHKQRVGLADYVQALVGRVGVDNALWLVEHAMSDPEVVLATADLMDGLTADASRPAGLDVRKVAAAVLGSKAPDKKAVAVGCSDLVRAGVNKTERLIDYVGAVAERPDHHKTVTTLYRALGGGDYAVRIFDLLQPEVLSAKGFPFAWLAGLAADPLFARYLKVALFKPADAAGLPALFAFAATTTYPDPRVLDWADHYKPSHVQAVLADPHTPQNQPTFIDKVLRHTSVNPAGVAAFLNQTINFKTCLLSAQVDDGTTTIQVQQADRWYKGNVSERTGFLTATLDGNIQVDIHTHWNVDKLVLKSIHVSEGAYPNNQNGPELFGWEKVLVAKCIAAHNGTPTAGWRPSGPGSTDRDGTANPHGSLSG